MEIVKLAPDNPVEVMLAAELHNHCQDCFKATCKVRPKLPDSCEMVQCDLRCGAMFHACKLDEHLLLCPFPRVSCINQVSGCPIVLPRWKLGSHLHTCPASVIHCNMEWNRWPVYSKERQSRVPFVQENIHARYEQLDVALALRDQRMLNAALKAPRSTRRVLRNKLTQRFPAVPLYKPPSSSCNFDSPQDPSNGTSKTVSDDDSDAPWEIAKDPPGLQRSVYSELFKATRKATESLSAALTLVTDSQNNQHKSDESSITDDLQNKKLGLINVNTEDNKHISCTNNCDSKNCDGKCTSSVENQDRSDLLNLDNLAEKHCDDDYGKAISSSDCDNQENVKQHESDICKDLANDFAKATLNNSEDSLKFSEMNPDIDGEELPLNSVLPLKIVSSEPHFELPKLKSSDPHVELPSTLPIPPPPIPPLSLTLKEILALDLNVECITKYQAKPKSMYTFLCAQEFRRDEFPWHFRNVHDEIFPGLNGWMEHRCPLAHYGCTYSQRRFYPNNKGATVIYNDVIEAFGIKPSIPPEQLSCSSATGDFKEQGNNYDVNSTAIPFSKEPTPEILTSKDCDSSVQIKGYKKDCPETKTNLDEEEEKDIFDCAGVANGRDILTSLPVEVLYVVASHLDSHSLTNLALTCKLLRDVACSLLEEKGIVVQNWERVKIPGQQPSWQVTHKRWLYSPAFTAVKKWGIAEGNLPMAAHLASCPFNKRQPEKDPFPLHGVADGMPHTEGFWWSMRNMYPDFKLSQD